MSTQNTSVGTTFKDTQKSNEYLQAILTASKDHAIISTDIHGYILTSSVGVRSVFGLLPDEASGRDILTLFTDEACQKKLAEHIATCKAEIIEHKKIPQIRRKITCYLDVTFQTVSDEETNAIGFLCIVRDVTQNVLLQERLKSLSITDEVTGFYNQRHLFPTLEAELSRSRSSNRSFVLCFFDLDGLKKYNDTYGHLRGTQAIRDTASLLQTLKRADLDICYRYGGDEFIVIMLETNKRNARSAVERMRLRLCEHFQGKITASFGISESAASVDAEELVKRANRAMYRAKSQGKNCVVVWE
jgi:diguanylate cyclase (GGDEF)-like protein/PAS domain S-box-containing protein